MNFESHKKKDSENALANRLAKRATRHLVSKTDTEGFKPAMGLSFLGAVGWNIPIPTVLGTLLGKWMDKHFPYASISWTLNFLLIGLIVGIFSAWMWLKKEGIERATREQNRRNLLIEKTQSAVKTAEEAKAAAEAAPMYVDEEHPDNEEEFF